MKKRIKFSVSDNLDLSGKTIEYFNQSGFKQLDTNDGKLKFERGSITSNMLTINPLKLKSEIEIEIIQQEIIADFNINATGQILTQRDEKLWDSFIDNYKHFLTEKNFDFKTENKKRLNSTKRKIFEYFRWPFLIGLITGFSGRYVADWTGINWIVFIAIVCGAYLLLTKIISDKKRKKAF